MRRKSRLPSNRMPDDVPPRPGLVAWLVICGMGAAVAYLCVARPIFVVAIVIIAAVSWGMNSIDRRRGLRIASTRRAESICTFARGFDCRATDTWVIRAAFEELTSYVRFPVRPDDRLAEDLRIDSDDMEEIAEAIACRTGRRLDNGAANPLYGRVTTVRHVVEFFAHQRRVP